MTEIKGHSEGIWRTFAVKRTEDNDYVPGAIKEWLDSRNIRWSFQRYAVTKDEPAHISYRIEFSNTKILANFRKFITEHCEVMVETSWDERRETKRAYEFGTKIFNLMIEDEDFAKALSHPDYLMQAFHGFFNNWNRDYREEAEIYINFLAQLTRHIKHGLSLHDIGDE